MTNRQVTEKTVVFHFGDLSAEAGNAGSLVDDETRELPLISGRFAGRCWDAEELLREEERKTAARKKSPVRRRWFAPAALAGAALSFALLTGSLMGQARMTQMNDQILTAQEEVIVLRQERDRSQSRIASGVSMTTTEGYVTKTLGMQRRSQEQEVETVIQREDKATVLGIRRGQGFTYFCRTIIDKVGEYLH